MADSTWWGKRMNGHLVFIKVVILQCTVTSRSAGRDDSGELRRPDFSGLRVSSIQKFRAPWSGNCTIQLIYIHVFCFSLLLSPISCFKIPVLGEESVEEFRCHFRRKMERYLKKHRKVFGRETPLPPKSIVFRQWRASERLCC